jgi:hypothetical protein
VRCHASPLESLEDLGPEFGEGDIGTRDILEQEGDELPQAAGNLAGLDGVLAMLLLGREPMSGIPILA